MSKIQILLVEDNEVLSKMISEELTEAGFKIFNAYDGETGLRLALEKEPSLILLDVLLPKKNGLDVLEAIKKSKTIKDTPVIMLTMLGSEKDIEMARSLGAADYIVKSKHALVEIAEKVKKYFPQE
jgi:two-component system response regulator CpxR